MGTAPKVGYTKGAIGTMPVGNAYAFSSAVFGWLYPRPVSPPARRSKQLLVLLIAGLCECLYHNLARLLFDGEGYGKVPEDNSSSIGASALSRIMGFFPLSRTVGCFAYPPSCESPSHHLTIGCDLLGSGYVGHLIQLLN